MIIKFVKSSEKKKILAELNEQFGIEKLPYLLVESGRERIRAFSGSLSKEEILQMSHLTNIEQIGLYLIKKEDSLRLSMDAIHLLKSQITKNIIEITESQFNDWIRGKDISIPAQRVNIIIKYKKDLIGFGRSTGEKVYNYIPKDRRLKNQSLL